MNTIVLGHIAILSFMILVLTSADKQSDTVRTEDFEFWRRLGYTNLLGAIEAQSERNENKAKNVIFFVGDGMGNPSVAAARIFKARQEGKPFPEREFLSFERFPNVGHSKVTNVLSKTGICVSKILIAGFLFLADF